MVCMTPGAELGLQDCEMEITKGSGMERASHAFRQLFSSRIATASSVERI